MNTPLLKVVVVALLLTAGPFASAQDEAPQWLRDSMEHVSSLESFEADYTLNVPGQSGKVGGKIALRGGEDLFFQLGDGRQTLQLYSLEGNTTLHVPDNEKYLKMEESQFGILRNMGSPAINDIFVWLADFLQNETQIVDAVETATATNDLKLGETAARQLSLKYPAYALDVWVEQDDTPALLKMELRKPATATTPTLSLEFNNISANKKLEDSTFAFAPKEDSEEVESVQALLSPRENARIGTDAPAFTLQKLGGGNVSLADHKDKDIVLLDFFASWCGPCRMGMPVIDQLAKEYKDKGVVFYAVNLQEGEKVAQSFIDKNKILNVAVLLDPDGEIGLLYDAQSIPRSVIVGKDGKVAAIHRGYSPALKEEITKDLDKLLK